MIRLDDIHKTFPQPENWFGMQDEDYEQLLQLLD